MRAAVREELRERLGERSAHSSSIGALLASPRMDAAAALADLTEISSQVEAAVVLDDAGAVVASTLDDAEHSARLARAALDLLGGADKRVESDGRALTQLEAALREGSVFVVREEGRSIVGDDGPRPHVRARLLRPQDLPALACPAGAEAEARAQAACAEARSRCVGSSCSSLVVGGPVPLPLAPPRRAPRACAALLRRRLDGHARARRPRGRALLAVARVRSDDRMTIDELGVRLREHALLEGDFVLRSGRRSTYYLDKYRFETLPELLGPLGERWQQRFASASPSPFGSRGRLSARSRSRHRLRWRQACHS